ncbi:MAG: HEAT repeat domain-containing protein [Acidobacteriota bacterium]|nr:HEAT repeat domain-containing protein [Acidobacteriota bacterium]
MRPSVLALMTVCAALAQQPRIANAKLQSRPAGSGLEPVLQSILAAQSAPAWIGYSVPIVAGGHQSCCWNNGAMGGCALEPHPEGNTAVVNGNRTVQLEGATQLFVLLRAEGNKIVKVRTFTPDCDIDAGGLPVYWLTDVRPGESVRYLSGLAKNSAGTRDEERRNESAITALALHADASADGALESLAAPGQPDSLRRKAIFWLGNARGRRGYEVVSRIVREDPNDKLREHAVFALTQSKEPDAIPAVIRVAREDKVAKVRGQALFWLAQRAGRKIAASELNRAIENDPETEVKKKAVFGLTLLPENEGIPMLIQVARANRNPAVRKQAMFWLGQSKDPRALSFFEEILAR